MNVIGARPDGWWRDRDAAVRHLVASLAGWAAATGEAVTAVLDGDPPAGLPDAGPATVVFAGAETADDRIVRLVEADPDPAGLTVVTSDAELAARVRVAGAAVTGGGAFRRLLDPYWR